MSKKIRDDFEEGDDLDLDLDLDDKKDFSKDDDFDIDSGFSDDFSDVGGGPAPMDKHKDLLRDLTNFSPFLKELFYHWLGMSFDRKKQEYVADPALDPMINMRGAMWCIGFLKVYARSNNIITDINEKGYKDIMVKVIKVIWLNLTTRMEEFEIKNGGDLQTIAVQLEHATSLVLMGAGDGKYSKMLTQTVSRSENVSYNPNQMTNNGMYNPQQEQRPQRSGGFFGRMKNAFTGGER